MRHSLGALALAAACGFAAPPIASAADRALVNVTIGAGLEQEAARYGRTEYPELTQDLVSATASAAARGGFTRLDLVIEYARPNHPTINQLGLDASLSFRSVAIGGATITGEAFRADGSSAPLKFSWYETDLRQEYGATTWTDAERAFQFLGGELARGHTPDHLGPGTLSPRGPVRLNDVF